MKPRTPPGQTILAIVDGEPLDVQVDAMGRVRIDASGQVTTAAVVEIGVATGPSRRLRISTGGDGEAAPLDRPLDARVAVAGDVAWVFIEGEVFEVELTPAARAVPRRRSDRAGADALSAPMPATVSRLLVEVGQQVARGDTLILLEAMKMEMPIKAPHDGRVRALRCRTGELVQPGQTLVELAGADTDSDE